MAKDVDLHPFLSKPGEGQILIASGLTLRVGSAQNGGAFEIIELGGTGNPPPHVHHDHDECFYIIRGTFTFTLGKEELEAPTDSIVYVPRNTPHAFMHSEGARAIVIVFPAQLEGFFRQLGAGLAAGRSETDLRAELAGKYDSRPVR